MRHAKEIRENVVDYSCWSEGRVVLELIVCQKSLAPVYLELHDDLQVTGRQEVAFFLNLLERARGWTFWCDIYDYAYSFVMRHGLYLFLTAFFPQEIRGFR